MLLLYLGASGIYGLVTGEEKGKEKGRNMCVFMV